MLLSSALAAKAAAAQVRRDGADRSAFEQDMHGPLPDGSWVVQGRLARPSSTVRLGQILKLQNDDGRLTLLPDLDRRVAPLLKPGRRVLARIDGSPSVMMLEASRLQEQEGRVTGVILANLAHPEAATAGRVALVGLRVAPGSVTLFGSTPEGRKIVLTDFVRGGASLVVFAEEGEAVVRLQAEDLYALYAADRQTGQALLTPLVMPFAGSTNPFAAASGDAYRAFTQIEPSAAERERVFGLMRRLVHPEPAVREAATQELAEHVDSAVLVASRQDLSRLPPEVRLRLQTLVSQCTRRPEETPQQLLADPAFLQDCLLHPDARVRRAARDALR
ncbi:MAG: hypothetical protein ACFCVE_04315 [Phycisphaerae bacterium]